MNSERLLQRFVRYAQVDTTARPETTDYPSSPGQLELGRILVEELRSIGLADAAQDEFGLVMATIPATIDRPAPVVALCAHLDTSPETSGKGVKPQIIRAYAGGDVVLPNGNLTIRVADNPELKNLHGKTLITSDGTTLLGADDKAGLAVIMETAAWLVEHPEIPRGQTRICFTCDEEIGRGVDHVDLAKLGADVCYTLDGFGQDEIDIETFSADLATITIEGVNIHPSIGKGRMVNAVRIAADLLKRLPRSAVSPETTEGREGFLHPYEIEGGVARVVIRVLLRDFEMPRLRQLADMLHEAAVGARAENPKATITIDIKEQYRNMADGLRREPRAVALAVAALERLGRKPKQTIIRGGTDGSRLTEIGLPTPNLSTGEHNPHSPLEWTCLEEMTAAAEGLVELLKVWGEQ